jgi:hypothetical protein
VRTKRIVQPGHSLFRLAGPWSGIRPWLAMTLRNDAIFQAERGVNFRDVCSRMLNSSIMTLDRLAKLVVFKQCLYKFTLSLK